MESFAILYHGAAAGGHVWNAHRVIRDPYSMDQGCQGQFYRAPHACHRFRYCPLVVRHSGTSCFQADEAAAGSLLSAKAWPSYICGFIVGCLQIPLVFGKCFSRVKYVYMHDMIVFGKNSSNE